MLKELKNPKIRSLTKSLINVVENYHKSEKEQGREVDYCKIIGALEYAKVHFIDESFEE